MADLKNTIVRGTLNTYGHITANSDVLVKGNLVVQGSTTVTNTETVQSQDQLIELGYGRAATPLTSPAGFYINNYDGQNAGALVFDADGIAYVGDAVIVNGKIDTDASFKDGFLRPLVTRKNLSGKTDGDIVKWDADSKSLIPVEYINDIPYLPTAAGKYTVLEDILYATPGVSTNKIILPVSSSIYNSDYGIRFTNGKIINNTNGDIGIITGTSTGRIFIKAQTSTKESTADDPGLIISSTNIIGTSNNVFSIGTENTRMQNIYATNINATTFTGELVGNASTATSADLSLKVQSCTSNSNKSFAIPFVEYSQNNTNIYRNVDFFYNPGIQTLRVPKISGELNGNASSATRAASLDITEATSEIYNLTMTNAATTSTGSNIYMNTSLQYNASTGTLYSEKYNINNKSYIQYNAIDECIEFIFE